ncbi:hypothetical protein C8Q74DRAFT_976585 [Fomes fomentarius]|nr:hypothetical protein C8Q74DRAFT_976585 [Fomes fomentarius]
MGITMSTACTPQCITKLVPDLLPTAAQHQRTSRLPVDAIIGITISVLAFAAAVCTATVLCSIRMRKRKHIRTPRSQTEQDQRIEGSLSGGAGRGRGELCDSWSSSTRILARDPSHPIDMVGTHRKAQSTGAVWPRLSGNAYLEREDPNPTESDRSRSPAVASSANATVRSPDSDTPPYYVRYNISPPPTHINGNRHILRTGAPQNYRLKSHVARGNPPSDARLDGHVHGEDASSPSSVPPRYLQARS